MNREIKFRAWDEDRKRMVYTFSDVYDINLTKIFTNEENELFAANLKDNYDWQEPKLMQYTGLKDKNGKEIYEGDLVSESGSRPYEVMWQSHSVQWIMQHTDEGRGYRHMAYDYAQMNYEVIGNIYENSELLPDTTF